MEEAMLRIELGILGLYFALRGLNNRTLFIICHYNSWCQKINIETIAAPSGDGLQF